MILLVDMEDPDQTVRRIYALEWTVSTWYLKFRCRIVMYAAGRRNFSKIVPVYTILSFIKRYRLSFLVISVLALYFVSWFIYIFIFILYTVSTEWIFYSTLLVPSKYYIVIFAFR